MNYGSSWILAGAATANSKQSIFVVLRMRWEKYTVWNKNNQIDISIDIESFAISLLFAIRSQNIIEMHAQNAEKRKIVERNMERAFETVCQGTTVRE